MGCASGGGSGSGSSNPVQGKDVLFKIAATGGYKPVLISKSVQLNTSADLVEITTMTDGTDPEEGVWKNYDYDSLSYSISLEGVMKCTDPNDQTGWDLLELQRQFLEVPYQLVFTDESNNTKTVSGKVAVKNVTFSATPNALVTQSFELQGLGKYTIS